MPERIGATDDGGFALGVYRKRSDADDRLKRKDAADWRPVGDSFAVMASKTAAAELRRKRPEATTYPAGQRTRAVCVGQLDAERVANRIGGKVWKVKPISGRGPRAYAARVTGGG